MLEEYFETRAARLEAEKPGKALKEKEDKLSDAIFDAMHEANQTSAKRGKYRATLESVAGRVSWKDEFSTLCKAAEAAGVKVETPVAPSSQRLSVVPC